MKRIGIVGGGSIGLVLAGYLSKGQFDVTIYTRTSKQADYLHKKGLTLTNATNEMTYSINSKPFLETTSLEEDLLFLAVKEYHLAAVVAHLSNIKGKFGAIIFLQNGMGHLAYLDKLSDRTDSILVGIIDHGALKHSLTEVEHTGIGEMKIGAVNNKSSLLETTWTELSKNGFKTSVYEDWFEIMVRKLVANAVINPLTAIYKVNNGSLITNDYYFKVMRELFAEVSLIYHCTEADWQRVIDVCKQTSHNRSSMLKDIENGGQTEIDAMVGVILEKAVKKNIQLPYLTFVFNSIKGMEFQRKRGYKDE